MGSNSRGMTRRQAVGTAASMAATGLAASLGVGVSAAHAAADYPSKPVRIIVGFTPGGTTDVVARILAKELTQALGQSFIVENKPGGGSNIATDYVAAAPADGYTLLCVAVTSAINQTLYPKAKFDLTRDFDAVVLGTKVPNILVVSNNVLTFVPSVRTINGVSSFGFQRNETYIITLSGGASSPFSIRNTGGGRLTKEFSCTVVASRGIADDDQQPPSASLVAPTNTNAAPLDPTIVLRFSELIDTTPLRGALTPSSPLRYTLRRAISGANGLTCDRDSAGTVLLGIPRLSTEHVGDHDVTVVTFKPTVQLPGESCVEVVVTADLRDLSGRQATPAAFEFFTQAGVSTPLTFSEAFGSPANLDELVSGAGEPCALIILAQVPRQRRRAGQR